MTRKSGLGKGLDALIPRAPAAEHTTVTVSHTAPASASAPAPDAPITELPTSGLKPNPHQPRKHFDDAELAELAQTIETRGVLQPIIVRRRAGHYEIVSGERRWRAASKLGLERVPVRVVEMDDQTAFVAALIENVQRTDLNPIEEARGYRELSDVHGLTQEEIARQVGKSRPAVANTLGLLDLPDAVRDLCERGELSRGHLKALFPLARAPWIDACVELAEGAAHNGWTVRQLEEYVEQTLDRGKPAAGGRKGRVVEPPVLSPEIKRLLDDLERTLSLRVTLRHRRGGHSGKLTLHYASIEELGRIIRRLKGQEK